MRWGAGITAVVGLVVAACGVPTDDNPQALRATPEPTPTATPAVIVPRQAAIFLLDEENFLVAVDREIDPVNPVPNIVGELAAGATPDEVELGLRTAIDPNIQVLAGTPVPTDNGLLEINITPPTDLGTGSQIEAFAQLVYTLTGFQSVDMVQFTIDGESVPIPTQLGGADKLEPLTRADYPCFDRANVQSCDIGE